MQMDDLDEYHTSVAHLYPREEGGREGLPRFMLSAIEEIGQAESTIPVLKQRSYTGKRVITSALANSPCSIDLGINRVLEELNTILGTSHTLFFATLGRLPYFAQGLDFGTTYAYLHLYWNSIASIEHRLRTKEEEDREMRRRVLVDGRITTRHVPPRRVWDLYTNRVIPYWVARKRPWGISHAWVDEKDRINVMTPINGHEWPVPMPKDANLDLIRIEMLNFGAEYVWLDVLCLRQEGGKNEHLRLEEWKLDVPTIGSVYGMAEQVVCYFSGLGRPLHLTLDDFDSDRSWFRRAWTLQEITQNPIIGGQTGNDAMEQDVQTRFDKQLTSLRKIRQDHCIIYILSEMQNRVSAKPLDRVAGLVYLLKLDFIPAYKAEQSPADAWEILVDAMEPQNRTGLLFYYPKPGNGNRCWRPSWQQAMMNNDIVDDIPTWLRPKVTRAENPGADWFTGCRIESGDVRGLDEVPKERKCREGQLVVKDITGEPYTIKIVAYHKYRIPNGSYTLIWPVHVSNNVWVVGQLREDGKFKKLSVFTIWPRYLDMKKFGVGDNVRSDLC